MDVVTVQVVFMGGGGSHALSLGAPDTVDYYITGDHPSPHAMQDNFSEQVVRVGDIGIFSPRVAFPTEEQRFEVRRLHFDVNDITAEYVLFSRF